MGTNGNSRLLTVTSEQRADVWIVRAVGEVDMESEPVMSAELARVIAGNAVGRPIVIDLSDVGFFGSAGVSALVRTRDTCQVRKMPLRVVVPGRHVRRTLDLVGVTSMFDIHASIDDALRVLIDGDSVLGRS